MRKTLIFGLVALFAGAWTFHLLAGSNGNDDPDPNAANDRESSHEPAEIEVDKTDLDRRRDVRVTSYAEMLDEVRPSVVSIASARIVRVRDRQQLSPMEEFLRRFYGMPAPRDEDRGEPEERRMPNALGSGVIVSGNGYILTNNHVIVDRRDTPADEITVTLSDGREFPAEVVGRDPRTDVALLRIETDEDLPYMRFADSDKLRVGDIVFAIGNPFGLDQTVSKGIVSATGRSRLGILGSEGYENFIQTDASINPGNSGGALVDADGRLVGLNTAIFARGGGNIGIGFAVPVNIARFIMENLIERGSVPRGYLGVTISDLDGDLAEAFELEDTDGVLIESVQPGEAADQAGVRRGDVIVGVNDRPVREVNELRLKIAQLRPGSTAVLTIVRDGERMTVEVVLGSLDAEVLRADEGAPLFEGVALAPLDDRLRREHRTDETAGIVVVDVERNSPYRNSLRVGMVILEINGRKVETLEEAQEAVQGGRINRLYVSYQGSRGYLAVRIP